MRAQGNNRLLVVIVLLQLLVLLVIAWAAKDASEKIRIFVIPDIEYTEPSRPRQRLQFSGAVGSGLGGNLVVGANLRAPLSSWARGAISASDAQ